MSNYPPRGTSIAATQRGRETTNTSVATSNTGTNPPAKTREGAPDNKASPQPESGPIEENTPRNGNVGTLNSETQDRKYGLPNGVRPGQGSIPTNDIPFSDAERRTRAAVQQLAEQNARRSMDVATKRNGGTTGNGTAGAEAGNGGAGTGINNVGMSAGTGPQTTGKTTEAEIGGERVGGAGTSVGAAGNNPGIREGGGGTGSGTETGQRCAETGVGVSGRDVGTGVGDGVRGPVVGGQTEREKRKELERQVAETRKKREEEAAHRAEEARRQQEEARKRQLEQEREWLQSELIRLDTENRTAAQEIQDLETKNESLKTLNRDLGQQWSKLSAELDAQRKVLNATRAFASREGTVDAQALIQLFSDLNASIGDYAFEVLRGLNDKAESRALDEDDFASLRIIFTPSSDPNDNTVDPNIRPFFDKLEKMKDDLTPMDIIDPIIQFTLCHHLYYKIFQPFAPSLTVEKSDALYGIYRKMRLSEPQERSARWRSITYKQVLGMQAPGMVHNFVENERNAFVKLVYDVLNALNKGEEAKPPTDLFKAAGDIFLAAMKVQERAKTEYVSFDYEVTFYRREYQPKIETADGKERTVMKLMRPVFDPSLMEVSQGGKGTTPRSVWMTVGLGMIALKTVRSDDGMKDEMSTPVKAKVICDTWDPNA